MNRLIIIGNGFDLAHGMKTRYYDFLVGYLRQCFLEAREKTDYEDELVKIYRRRLPQDKPVEKWEHLSEFLFYKDPINKKNYHFPRNSIESTRGSTPIKDFAMEVKSDFFKHLLDHCSEANWVDIENEYYKRLVQLLDKEGKDGEEELRELNNTFRVIISKLEAYLVLQQPAKLEDAFFNIFKQSINSESIIGGVFSSHLHLPDNSLLLNFNYTDTVSRYLGNNMIDVMGIDPDLVHIHGELNKPDNPIIFGFGDELDKDYQSIENDTRKGFFEFIKSFGYFKTNNYHKLIRFIGMDEYEVFILGHSCGLSDRTMLNMIFEHDLCRSVRIFYHQREDGTNNFTELTQEIARHFNNKGVMRKKIVPFPFSTPMPQVKIP